MNKVEILFNQLIRPLILEYGSPAWNPWYSKDITHLEKVQRRCYKICNSPDFVPEPLIMRRLKTGICEVYKYLHDMYRTEKSLFVTQSQHTLQGNNLKLIKPYARTLIRSNFSHRVVNNWNSLPDSDSNTNRSLPLGLEG